MDGARFANALVRLGCTPAEMTWKAGVDAVSFGGTKNGLMGVEAAVIFDKALAWEFELRRKRGAHLFSKHRYLAAQMGAYLDGDLWLEMAGSANAACARLARGLRQVPGAAFHYEPEANIIFAEWSRAGHRRLHEAGAAYYLWNGTLDERMPDGLQAITGRAARDCDWSAGRGRRRSTARILGGAGAARLRALRRAEMQASRSSSRSCPQNFCPCRRRRTASRRRPRAAASSVLRA